MRANGIVPAAIMFENGEPPIVVAVEVWRVPKAALKDWSPMSDPPEQGPVSRAAARTEAAQARVRRAQTLLWQAQQRVITATERLESSQKMLVAMLEARIAALTAKVQQPDKDR